MYLGNESNHQQERSANKNQVGDGMTYRDDPPDCQKVPEGQANTIEEENGQLMTPDQISDNIDNGEESGGGFGYSQKFFHISDGNLYSVFSPLQGRSYGVKPSFLRKHRCTVRETKTATGNTSNKKTGRRNQRKGLKFHNFIPSESITSEREEKIAGANTDQNGRKKKGLIRGEGQIGTGEVWKVHAECRLREEHGTKQIMVSNWSLSSDSPALPKSPKPQQPVTPTKVKTEETKTTKNDGGVKPCSVLQQYLEYGKMLPETDNGVTSKDENRLDQDDGKKRRRKATTTRRVVPYTKYLTMVDDGPLDLSRQTKFEDDNLIKEETNVNSNVLEFEKTREKNESNSARVYGRATNQILPPGFMSLSQNHRDTNCLNYRNNQRSNREGNIHQNTAYQISQGPSQSSQIPSQNSPNKNQNSQSSQYQISQGPNLNNNNNCTENGAANRVRRKPSQRTIIRQKLEDTFKQNGFLVKTKQVSDGDATFCKFKQLRKYTRYYLKSWHQHLPDEVHKLWKGFLPPKTNINVAKNNNVLWSTDALRDTSTSTSTRTTLPERSDEIIHSERETDNVLS